MTAGTSLAGLEAAFVRQLRPTRDAWQLPDRVLASLGLERGSRVCEVGCGAGYFTPRLAEAVGPTGTVYAVDVVPRVLARLRESIVAAQLSNVTPVLGAADCPLVPERSCDLVLMVNTFRLVDRPVPLLRALARVLRPRGRLACIDWHPRPTPEGPPLELRRPVAELHRAARRAGLRVWRELDYLPYQYFVVLKG